MKLAKAGCSWRTLAAGREGGGFVELSATKKGPGTCHVTKSTYHFPVCVPLSVYLHYVDTSSCYSLIKLHFLVPCVLYLPFVVFLPAWKVNGQNQGWLKLISRVRLPKTSVQAIFCHLLTQLSHLPQPFSGSWLWHLHCGNAARVPSGNFFLENWSLCLSSSVAAAGPVGLALP